MQTLLDVAGEHEDWPVRLAAGLPGGIGNTGYECGGVTAPLIVLGMRHGLGSVRDGLPIIFDKGHDLCQRFGACHGTLLCRDIRGTARVPLRCAGVVRRSGERFAEAEIGHTRAAIGGEKRVSYGRLYAHYKSQDFHCAQVVLRGLRDTIPVSQELQDAASGFIGGTLFQGMTCSALAAGVMAVGLKQGGIEDSRLRVIRMIATMVAGGDGFADSLNEFNRIMNLGNLMAERFTDAFGSTQCRTLTKCDFSTSAGVSAYIEGNRVARCRHIAGKVVDQVRDIVQSGM